MEVAAAAVPTNGEDGSRLLLPFWRQVTRDRLDGSVATYKQGGGR